MAISTYAELKTAVANYLARGDLTARIPEFIDAGLQRINNELIAHGGIPDQEQIATASTVADQESLAVPTDYAMLRWIKIDDSTTSPVDPLELMDYDSMIEVYRDDTGVPAKFTVADESFYFRPIPDAVYTVRIAYVKRYATLSADGDTNYLLTAGGNVLLYAALLESESFIQNDQRISTWGNGYKEALKNLLLAARKSRHHRPRQMVLDRALLNGAGYGSSIESGVC